MIAIAVTWVGQTLFLDYAFCGSEIPSCSDVCDLTQVYMNTMDGAKCISRPSNSPIANLVLSFDLGTEVVCTHSAGSGIATYTGG